MNRIAASALLLGAALLASSLVPASLSAEREAAPPALSRGPVDASPAAPLRAERSSREQRGRLCQERAQQAGLHGDDLRLFMIRCMSGSS